MNFNNPVGRIAMKKLLVLTVCLILALSCTAFASGKNEYKIGVTVIVEHPALQADQKGFAQALKDAGINAVYDVQNAQGQMPNAKAIADKFKSDKVDLVHAIATPTAQAAVKAIKDIPVVYSSVTDPVDAGLVKSMGPSETNVTGISDLLPVGRQLELYAEMMPKAKRWGSIYNSGEANSMVLVKLANQAWKKMGMDVVEVSVSNSSEVLRATQSLIGRVDAIYVSTDNTVVSALPAVAKVCASNNIVLFAGDVDSINKGAAAAMGFDYYQVGYSAGKKAVEVLKGKKPGEIPSGYTEKLSLHLNLKNAKKQGLSIAEKYIKMADKVVK
jgi:putative ABC transport system substrate-binding protein